MAHHFVPNILIKINLKKNHISQHKIEKHLIKIKIHIYKIMLVSENIGKLFFVLLSVKKRLKRMNK